MVKSAGFPAPWLKCYTTTTITMAHATAMLRTSARRELRLPDVKNSMQKNFIAARVPPYEHLEDVAYVTALMYASMYASWVNNLWWYSEPIFAPSQGGKAEILFSRGKHITFILCGASWHKRCDLLCAKLFWASSFNYARNASRAVDVSYTWAVQTPLSVLRSQRCIAGINSLS